MDSAAREPQLPAALPAPAEKIATLCETLVESGIVTDAAGIAEMRTGAPGGAPTIDSVKFVKIVGNDEGGPKIAATPARH